MKTNQLIAGLLVFLLHLVAAAQPPQKDIPITVKVIKTYQQNLDRAISLADSACFDSAEKGQPYAWYTRAFVYKEKFKLTDSTNIRSEWRETALSSLRKSMELDVTGENHSQMRTLLDYLSNTYYTQLTHCLDFYVPEMEQDCGMLWLKYRETQEVLGNYETLNGEAKNYYFTLADRHMGLYEQQPQVHTQEVHKAFACYGQILKLDPSDYKANYNTAIYYYNQGVNVIRGFNENTTIEELIALQDNCIQLFRQSLPFMLKAQELKPDRQETLKGLYIIYRALSEDDASFFYKTELEKLIKSGGTNPLKWENKDQ